MAFLKLKRYLWEDFLIILYIFIWTSKIKAWVYLVQILYHHWSHFLNQIWTFIIITLGPCFVSPLSTRLNLFLIYTFPLFSFFRYHLIVSSPANAKATLFVLITPTFLRKFYHIHIINNQQTLSNLNKRLFGGFTSKCLVFLYSSIASSIFCASQHRQC